MCVCVWVCVCVCVCVCGRVGVWVCGRVGVCVGVWVGVRWCGWRVRREASPAVCMRGSLRVGPLRSRSLPGGTQGQTRGIASQLRHPASSASQLACRETLRGCRRERVRRREEAQGETVGGGQHGHVGRKKSRSRLDRSTEICELPKKMRKGDEIVQHVEERVGERREHEELERVGRRNEGR